MAADALEVLATGPLATVQDLGRPGYAAWGVGPSGAADRAALRRANRLVGGGESDAGIEVTMGGLRLRPRADLAVALTGAPCPVTVDGRAAGHNALLRLRAGEELALGVPATGLRTYVGVRGGLQVPAVLGSRATDLLAGLGPQVLAAGSLLAVGPPPPGLPDADLAPVPDPAAGDLVLRVLLGPRDDWFTPASIAALTGSPWTVTADSNRVGMRLDGAPLQRSRQGELPSEGLLRGALQVPPTGLPTLMLADHPLTGGYPVVAVVPSDDVDLAAQARPGQRLVFHAVPAP